MVLFAKAKRTDRADRPPVYVPGLGSDDAGPGSGAPTPKRRRWIVLGGIGAFVLLVIAMGNVGGGDSRSGSTPVGATATTTVTRTVAAPSVAIAAPASTVTVTEAAPPVEAAPPAAFVAPPVVAPADAVPPVDLVPQGLPSAYAEAPPLPSVEMSPASAYYENCSAARSAGVAPLHAGEPGYSSKLDRDGDGVACE